VETREHATDVVGELGIHGNGRVVRPDARDHVMPGERVRKPGAWPSPARDPRDADDIANDRRDERVEALLPLETVSSVGALRESEDHPIVDEISFELPAVAEPLDGGDGELRKLLANHVAHDVGGQLAIGGRRLVETDGSRHRRPRLY
jgi:hypothetical protein